MSNEEKNGPISAKKPIPVWLMLILDALLIAACILSFAYFHHVNPLAGKQDDTLAEYTAFIPKDNPHTRPTTAVTEDNTVPVSTDSSESISTTKTEQTDSTEPTDVSEETTASGTTEIGVTGSVTASSSARTTQTTAKTTATTSGPKYDLSGWGAKWPERFSIGNEIVAEDNFYKSHDMNITVSRKQVGSSVAFVADVYLRYYDNFMSAAGHDVIYETETDSPKKSKNLENMSSLAARKNAVIAFNGDFFGQRDTGMIVRGGETWRKQPKGDVGCYYYDGSFRSFNKDSFDLQTELSNGLYHSMTFGPVLVQDGVARTNIQSSVKSANPRTGFGYYEPGHYVVVVVDGRQEGYSEGLTLDEFAALFDDLGCKEAYNLDGGASSVMYFNGRIVNKQSSARSMSDIFYFAEVQG